MKIEKVNDNQIRCTLTKADLAERELKLSELAYGTEKAKSLFRDMMQQAAIKYGFEAENIPLMIEAIPLNSDCIVLIITKVEDPEELDTRFSRFAPGDDSESEEDAMDLIDGGGLETLSHAQGAVTDEVMGLFKRIRDEAANIVSNMDNKEKESHEAPKKTITPATKFFVFDSMSSLIKPAVALKGVYDDTNSLYKDEDGSYILVLNMKTCSTESFNKACNVLSEYGKLERMLATGEFYLKEHCDCVIESNAIQSLAKVM